MHAFNVNAAVIRRLQRRSHTITDLAHRDPEPIETIRDADGCTHLVGSAEACAAIFSDTAFVPSEIASAVASVGRAFGTDVSALESFLRETPLLACGADHKAKRNRFLRHHNLMRSEHAAFIQDCAERHFAELDPGVGGGLSRRAVVPYVDAVLHRIFDSELDGGGALYDRLAEGPSTILELIHHPRLLGNTSRRVADFLAALDSRSASAAPVDEAAWPFVLLGYALMGRDPLIGGLSALMHDIVLTRRSPAQRNEFLAELSAGRLFRMTTPVNFVGREVSAERQIDGVTMRPGDRLLLLVPVANAQENGAGGVAGLAFGHGPHVCAGIALSLAIGDAFIAALRRHVDRLDTTTLEPETLVPGVFLRYKSKP